jgi:hypothetical protein
MNTHQLTSSQGEADGVSEWEYDIAGVGGGEFALRLVPHQRAASFYWRTRTHSHTVMNNQDYTICSGITWPHQFSLGNIPTMSGITDSIGEGWDERKNTIFSTKETTL